MEGVPYFYFTHFYVKHMLFLKCKNKVINDINKNIQSLKGQKEALRREVIKQF